MNYFPLKIPVYITDEFGPGGALLLILIGVATIFLAVLIAGRDIPFISSFAEEFIFKIGIGISITGVISFIISLLQ